jgi:molybdopterin-dependent oxidoreductase alpha subunit
MPTERSAIESQAPEETSGLRLIKPSQVATGFPAIVRSLESALSQESPATTARTWLRINQEDGFDCPSCAWADPEGHRSTFEFCESGAKAMADAATNTRLTPELFAQQSVEELSQRADHYLNALGRITHPMMLRPGSTHFEPIAWDDAFGIIAKQLKSLGSPDEAVFYTSGKAVNESAFVFQLFARAFGTNNLPDCSNMCHESSGLALTKTLGIGKSTVTIEDLENADCILEIGHNPGTNHPRMLTSLQIAKKRGAKMIAVNPMPEVSLFRFAHPQKPWQWLGKGTALADLYLQVRVNGDIALVKGFIKGLFELEDANPGLVLDRPFIEHYTGGFTELEASIRACSWESIVEGSGIALPAIREAAAMFAKSERTVICWCMGLTQHHNGVENIQEMVNLLLLRGNMGRAGAGALCVRGHSNVQGDRTMGIWEKIDDAFLDRLRDEFHFEPPREHGMDTISSIHAMADGRVGVFMALGGNFLSATPDTPTVARGLNNVALNVHIATKLNRGHLFTGGTALILPCLSRTERDVQASGPQISSVENTVSKVTRTVGRMAPASEHLLSEVAIICGIAKATVGDKVSVDWDAMAANYDVIRDHVSHVVPGTEEYNERVREKEGFYMPIPPKERIFKTDTGKAKFTVNPMSPIILEAGQLFMTTIRSHDQFNTVVYGLEDKYRGISGGRRVIFMHPDDMAARGLEAKTLVDITSHFRGQERSMKHFQAVPYPIARGCTATYYPEANPLVPLDSVARGSCQPASKSIVISVVRSADQHTSTVAPGSQEASV